MKQAKMISRLIDIKQRAADSAETAHVAAHHASMAAEQTLKQAVQGWNTFLASSAEVTSVADLEHRDRQYKWLRKVIDDAEKGVMIARNDESAKRELMTEARIELRRYETWLENSKEQHRQEAARVQRLMDDEVAARKGRASNG
jgi:flagellar biosynthesis chaperone FliJ